MVEVGGDVHLARVESKNGLCLKGRRRILFMAKDRGIYKASVTMTIF